MLRHLVAPALLLVLIGLAVGPLGPVEGDEDAVGEPDFDFFVARIAPLLEVRCASCHASRRKRGRGHALRPVPGKVARPADHRANYETILELIDPGNPAGSEWLLSAVGKQQGGHAHGGGGVIRIGSLECRTMIDFINGATLPPPPKEATEAQDEFPRLGVDGVVLAATDAEVTTAVERDGDPRRTSFLPTGATRRMFTWRVVAEREAVWNLTFRVEGRGAQAQAWIDGRPLGRLRVTFGGPGNTGVRRPLSAGEQLVARTGSMEITKGVIHLETGDGDKGGFLVPVDVEHDRVEADLLLPDEAEGGVDALLLVGARSLDDAAFVGLLDGGRVLALGRFESGAMRVIASTRLDPPARGERHRCGIRWGDEHWEAKLDGTTRLEAPLEQPIEVGRFGVRTAGHLQVHALEAFAAWRVYEASFTMEPVVRLARGTHTIQLVTGDGIPTVERLVLRPRGAEAHPTEALTPLTPRVRDPLDTLPPSRPAPLTRTAVRRFDRDGDGKVSRDEYPGSDAQFDARDGNGDGFLEADEEPAGE